jgi:hypothetical protein
MSVEDKQAVLERCVDRTLQGQPLLQAPATLQARVLERIAHGAAPAWWRQSFPRWPLPAQAAFVLVCAGLAKALLQAPMWMFAQLRTALPAGTLPVSELQATGRALASVSRVDTYLFESIPMHWLMVGSLAGVALYAAFFGLGAAAYRTLYK